MEYFVGSKPGFAAPSLALGLLVMWIVVAAGAVLWLRSATPKNAARLAFRQRTGTALLVIAGLGIVQLITRMVEIPVIEWRLWTYLIFFAGLGYAIYAWNDASKKLPRRAATSGRVQKVDRAIASRKPSSAGPAGSATPNAPAEPRPVAMTGRREARRAKKKR